MDVSSLLLVSDDSITGAKCGICCSCNVCNETPPFAQHGQCSRKCGGKQRFAVLFSSFAAPKGGLIHSITGERSVQTWNMTRSSTKIISDATRCGSGWHRNWTPIPRCVPPRPGFPRRQRKGRCAAPWRRNRRMQRGSAA